MPAPGVTVGTPGSQDFSGTSFTVALPAGTSDKMILFFSVSVDGATAHTISPPAGWTIDTQYDVVSGIRRVAILRRAATSDTSVAVGTSVGCRAVWIPLVTDGDVTGLVLSESAPTGSSASTINPAAVSVPSGDYRVLALGAWLNSTLTITGWPTSYSDHQTTIVTGANAGRPCLAMATRALTGITSEDPGVFTMSGTANQSGLAIAIPGAAGAPPVDVEAPVGVGVAVSGRSSVLSEVREPRLTGRSVHYDFAGKKVSIESGV